MKRSHTVLLGVVCISIAASGTYLVFRNGLGSSSGASQEAAAGAAKVPDAPPLTPARTAPHGYKEYRNEFYRFEVFYPQDASVQLEKEKGSAATITFTAAGHALLFKVHVVPFGGLNITESRLHADTPSGVIDNESTATIDKAKAVTFDSVDPASHEPTSNIWFIQEGFLYEISAPKASAAVLTHLMTSWIFLERGKPSTYPAW